MANSTSFINVLHVFADAGRHLLLHGIGALGQERAKPQGLDVARLTARNV
jgi:hypothetical protein